MQKPKASQEWNNKSIAKIVSEMWQDLTETVKKVGKIKCTQYLYIIMNKRILPVWTYCLNHFLMQTIQLKFIICTQLDADAFLTPH